MRFNSDREGVDLVPQFTVQRLLVFGFLAAGIAAALLREILFAHFYGAGPEIGVFRIAFSLPNLLSQSIAPAFIGAAIPLLVSREAQGSAAVRLLGSRLIHVAVAGSLCIALMGIISASLLSKWLAPAYSPEQLHYLSIQLRWLWVFFLFVTSSFSLRAILSTRGILWPGASSSFVISATFCFGCLSASIVIEDGEWTAGLLVASAIIASLIVLAVHMLHRDNLIRHLLKAPRKLLWNDSSDIKAIATALGSLTLFKVTYELPRIIDRAVASGLEQGSVAALDYSFGIINVPGIMIGTSLIIIAYPAFSKSLQSLNSWQHLKRYGWLLAGATALAILGGLAISDLSAQIVSIVYERGAFGAEDSMRTSVLLRWHGLALGAMVGSLLLCQALFAFQAHWTALGLVVARITAKCLAVEVLIPTYGLDGLGISFLVTEIVTLILAAIVVYRLTMSRIHAR